ncbi:hypothetical protein VLF92_13315, partial [Pseudomonas chengduensis]
MSRQSTTIDINLSQPRSQLIFGKVDLGSNGVHVRELHRDPGQEVNQPTIKYSIPQENIPVNTDDKIKYIIWKLFTDGHWRKISLN